MIEQYHHKVTNSFLLWFDNYLLTKGQAYTNFSGVNCYHNNDERLDPTYQSYGSPYKQWVSDSSIPGATIANGVTIGNTPSGEYQSGVGRGSMKIDFDNGRALIEGSNENLDVTCDFAVKDFNIYFTNDTEEDLIVENKYEINSRIPRPDESYITPYDQVIPAAFISTSTSQNRDFAFGGMEETTINITVSVMSENSYQLDGILSIFSDSKNESIALIPMADHPYDEFNDLKSGYYNYKELAQQFKPCALYVNNANTSKLTDRARKSLINEVFVGFIDFEIQQHRFRHQ
jgi:hypothetical protein